MSKSIPFVKMSGTGNDFILIDNRDGLLAEDQFADFARRHCPRRTGVGADGVLLLSRDPQLAFRMRYINPDGGEVDMCGNGARCIVAFARSVGQANGQEVTFRTGAGPVTAWQEGSVVKLRMTAPSRIESMPKLSLPGGARDACFLNTGVPHAVLMVDDVHATDVATLGAAVRHHDRFKPAGTNADFVQDVKPGHILVRTYERGVEAETYACGTGAVASALVAGMVLGMKSPITVHTHGGDELKIHFEGEAPHYRAAYLEGTTEVTFQGEVSSQGQG